MGGDAVSNLAGVGAAENVAASTPNVGALTPTTSVKAMPPFSSTPMVVFAAAVAPLAERSSTAMAHPSGNWKTVPSEENNNAVGGGEGG